MNKYYKLLMFVPGLLWLGACEENGEEPNPQLGSEVIVINEGNFQAGNGSLSTYNKETEQTQLQQLQPQTTIQDAILYQNRLYLVGNVPDEVEIVDTENFSTLTTISSGFLNPMSFAAINNTAFVTNWGDISTAFGPNPESFISIIDLNSNNVIDSVEVNYRPQQLVSLGGFIYIAFEGGDVVGKLDPSNFTIEELTIPINPTLQIPSGPSAFTVDNKNNLWVLTTSGILAEVITSDFSLGRTLENLQVLGFDEKMTIDEENRIYFLSSDASYQVDLNATSLSAQVFTDEDLNYYGIGVDPSNGDVYIGDSNGFTTTGTGFRYSKDGTLIDDFPTGIGPNNFLFF